MELVSFELPAMFADHHVLNVRRTLLAVSGVEEVTASAMDLCVSVEFDAAKTSAEALAQALEAAGYPPGKTPDLLAIGPAVEDESAWYQFEPRVTETNMADLEMSGDFRRY